eukprot:scaffold77172_cov26-Tisochrysis_lutea.AAC.1
MRSCAPTACGASVSSWQHRCFCGLHFFVREWTRWLPIATHPDDTICERNFLERRVHAPACRSNKLLASLADVVVPAQIELCQAGIMG